MPSGHSQQAARLVAEGYRAQQAGRTDVALGCYAKALLIQPGNFEAAYLAGTIHLQSGKFDDACRLLAVATAAKPKDVDALTDYGTALALSGHLSQALTVFDRCQRWGARHAALHINRANVLARLDRTEEAIAALDRARELDPSNPMVPNNRANALSQLGRFDEALRGYDDALAIAPEYVEAVVNRGNTLLLLKRDREAITAFEHALRMRGDEADAHYGLSFALLRSGDLTRGFREYEWRWRRSEMMNYRRDFGRPFWLGSPAIEDKTLLVHAEQGFGDTIHFVRYVQSLVRRGVRIVLEVQPALKPLLQDWPVSAVIGRGEPLPPFDLHCPLLSLPLALGEAQVLTMSGAYLAPSTERVSVWRDRIPQDGRLKVGVAWSGSKTFRNDRHRSMTLEAFSPIFDLADVTFVTLNPDVSPEDAVKLGERTNILPLAGQFRDFADTAAVIANLDFVVSTDTSIPHLAGALNKEVFILLGFAPDWRWFHERSDSPWYPSARLFRQPAIGDWASVIQKIRGEILRRANR